MFEGNLSLGPPIEEEVIHEHGDEYNHDENGPYNNRILSPNIHREERAVQEVDNQMTRDDTIDKIPRAAPAILVDERDHEQPSKPMKETPMAED